MKNLNNKGFTVIELVISFLFVSIICISMYFLIVSYKDRTALESIKSELTTFQSALTIDIHKDIERKILKEVKECPGVVRCIELFFKDDTSKKLEIKEEVKYDTVGSDTFPYNINYILYDNIRYSIPDAKYVKVLDNSMLNKTLMEDDLENKTTLYRIKISLKHINIEDYYTIRITVPGNENIYTGLESYTAYSTGDSVTARVMGETNIPFRVIRNSTANSAYVTLLYDGNYTSHGLTSIKFNNNIADGNKFENSIIIDELTTKTADWGNPREIRLITAEEIAYIIDACPSTKISAETIDLTGKPNWIYSSNYWTMTGVEDNSEKAWSISNVGLLSTNTVTNSYHIRPVIVIHKRFVN